MSTCFGYLPPCTTALTHVLGDEFEISGDGFRSGERRSGGFHVLVRRVFSVLAEHTLFHWSSATLNNGMWKRPLQSCVWVYQQSEIGLVSALKAGGVGWMILVYDNDYVSKPFRNLNNLIVVYRKKTVESDGRTKQSRPLGYTWGFAH